MSPDCRKCHFMDELRNPSNPLEKIMLCRQGPPQVVIIPRGDGTAAMQSARPPLIPGEWCHQFQPANDTELDS